MARLLAAVQRQADGIDAIPGIVSFAQRVVKGIRLRDFANADEAEEALRKALPAETDWTVNPETGRSNSSPLFKSLCAEVERLIRGDAHKLIGGRADMTAGLIMAQLAHVHHLAPTVSPQGARQEGGPDNAHL